MRSLGSSRSRFSGSSIVPRIIDVAEGDEYSIVEPGLEGHYKFIRMNNNKSMVLREVETNDERVVSYDQFALMRGRGSARRIVRDGVATNTDAFGPFHLLDGDDPKVGIKERKRRQQMRKQMTRARTLYYYMRRFDSQPAPSTYAPKLRRFLKDTSDEAHKYGFDWMPSTNVMRIALRTHGKPGNRNLGNIFANSYRHKKSHWPDWVDKLMQETVIYYWRPNVRMDTAESYFIDLFNERRNTHGVPDLKIPGRSTIRGWLNKSETKELFAAKWGKRNAHKRFVGTVESIKAVRPLEYVMIDHTKTDLWLRITDAAGNVVGIRRAYLVYAIDVYSHMVLGAYLTFEEPSVHSLMKCIKEVSRPKTELEEEFGEAKGATDGWGKVGTYIIDNGLEGIGVSLQTVLEAVGIDVIFAALRTPEHKAHVERMFGATNGLWHQLPGGAQGGKDKRKLSEDDARDAAVYTLPQAMRKLCRYIVTCYHVEKSSGIGIAPARKWSLGLRKFGRPTVDDVNTLDRILGKYKRCLLTTHGIRVFVERFHDTYEVTALIADMISFEKKREGRGLGQTATIWVSVFYDPMDCSFVNVLNEATGALVRLSNVFPDSTQGLAWSLAKELRHFAEEENLAYHSDEERARARRALFDHLEQTGKEDPKSSSRASRKYHAESLTLAAGNQVIEAEVLPSASGLNGIATTLPVSLRRDHGLAPKGDVRGGKKALDAAARTREKKKAEKQRLQEMAERAATEEADLSVRKPIIEITGPENQSVESGDATNAGTVTDIQSYMARRAADRSRRY
ncbi:transposase [Rhizobium leguminosarum bv. viciae]|nr:transposase [Rhizobium leguminosarum bv. viciae]